MSGCSKETPESVFNNYVNTLSKGNVDAAINLVMEPKEERRKSKLERELHLASEKIQAGELNVIFYEY